MTAKPPTVAEAREALRDAWPPEAQSSAVFPAIESLIRAIATEAIDAKLAGGQGGIVASVMSSSFDEMVKATMAIAEEARKRMAAPSPVAPPEVSPTAAPGEPTASTPKEPEGPSDEDLLSAAKRALTKEGWHGHRIDGIGWLPLALRAAFNVGVVTGCDSGEDELASLRREVERLKAAAGPGKCGGCGGGMFTYCSVCTP